MLKVSLVRGNETILEGVDESNNKNYSRKQEKDNTLYSTIIGFDNNQQNTNQPVIDNQQNNYISNEELFNRIKSRSNSNSNIIRERNKNFARERSMQSIKEKDDTSSLQPSLIRGYENPELDKEVKIDTRTLAQEVKPELDKEVNVNTRTLVKTVEPELEREVNIDTNEVVKEVNNNLEENKVIPVDTEEIVEEIKEEQLPTIDTEKLKESMTNINYDEASQMAKAYLDLMESQNNAEEEDENNYHDNEQIAKALGINQNIVKERKPKKIKQKQMEIDFSNY